MAGIVNGLFAGRSGIQSHGIAIAVLADNIANSNTVGFKASRANFSDLLAQSLAGSGGGNITAGNGSQIVSTTQLFTQGTFESTGRGLDVAIDGEGFFVLADGTGRFYSRAGNFQISADGILVNQNGLSVLGFPADGSGGLQEINVNNISQANIDTTSVTITGNLDASDVQNAPPGGSPSYTDLYDNAQYFTNVDVFDSLGAKHSLTYFFFHTDDGEWTVQAFVDGGDVSGGTAGTPEQVGADLVMEFDANGQRTSVGTPDMTLGITWDNGSAASSIETTFDPFTQFSATSAINSISQDGRGVGNIVSLSVESDGSLFAQLDNGLTQTIGTVALATFASPEGLQRSGDSLYAESGDSGEPVIGTPGTGKFGETQSGSLELSTADIADDFIKLISLQRGFQGSARIITSIDDLLQEIINLA